MATFAGSLLGFVGLVVLVGAFLWGGWWLVQYARRTGSVPLQFLGGALILIGAYGAVAFVVSLVRQL